MHITPKHASVVTALMSPDQCAHPPHYPILSLSLYGTGIPLHPASPVPGQVRSVHHTSMSHAGSCSDHCASKQANQDSKLSGLLED